MKWWTGLFTTRNGSFSYPSWHSEAKSGAVQAPLRAAFPLWFTYTSVLFTTRPFRRESVRSLLFSPLLSLLRLLLILLLFRKEVCWNFFFSFLLPSVPPPPPPPFILFYFIFSLPLFLLETFFILLSLLRLLLALLLLFVVLARHRDAIDGPA